MNKEILDKISKDNNTIGVCSLIADTKEIKDIYCYGKRSKEKNLDITPNSIFRIASVSKIIVALAALMLHDEGKMDIYEDISKYLGYLVRNPHFPNHIITTEMLMTQTSSINDGEDEVLGYDGVNGKHFYVSLERLLTDPNYEYYLDRTFMNVKPGSTFCYSNFGCGILACIVEKVSGQYFTDFIKERLLDKMNLDASFRANEIKNKDLIASLYRNDGSLAITGERFVETTYPKHPLGDNFRGPAGGLFISPVDLSKIMQMLMNNGTYENHTYLSKEMMKDMKDIHWKTLCPDGMYKQKGLQLMITDDYKYRLHGHLGNAYGLRSYMLFTDNIGYIFICNGANFKLIKDDISTMQEDFLFEMMK